MSQFISMWPESPDAAEGCVCLPLPLPLSARLSLSLSALLLVSPAPCSYSSPPAIRLLLRIGILVFGLCLVGMKFDPLRRGGSAARCICIKRNLLQQRVRGQR